ncbi:MAG: silent information regulator protein Sir2, partial [Eubacteriales bacterium]|nr:silent information regulator protein Sir2 [Eubacteriales bacterium]
MKHLMNKTSKKTWAWILAVVMTLSIIIPTSLLTAKAEVTAPTFSEAAGWFESAYAEWTSKGATQYKAYVKEAGAADSTYVQIDDELIRNYGDYWRVDAVGLKAGSYQIKVVASDGSKEANKVTDVLTVSAYDRTGFAWVDGTASGAYNEDGTLKSNAVVLYLTEDTKDTMTLDVVTSSKGATTACTGIVDILAAYKKGYDARPLDIRVIGKVTNEGKISSDDDSKGDIVISGSGSSKRLSCGVTIEGIGEDATAYGWGLRIKNSSNVEVRNIGFMMCDSAEGDNVGLQQDNDHVWVHNCDMFYGQAGGDKDQAKGDGALDSKLSTYVTFSYNHFWDSGKCNLLGLKEGTTKGYYITYHHNWYDHSDSRHPRCRYYSAHVYNNYYDGNSKYGIGSTLGSSVFAEGNYFRNCQYPILTSMQGSDVFAGGTSRDVANNATFSKEAGGTIKAFNNIMTGKYTFIPYGSSTYTLKGTQTAFNLDGTSSTADFDAVVVSSASEKVDSSVKSYLGSNTYNNFDTSSSMYSYTADAPEDVPSIVTATAGRMNGGDFSWTFNNEVDDESYAVNAELKAALVSYESSVKSIGGSVNKSEDTTKDSTADTTSATTKADETTSATSTTKAEETTTAGQSGTAGVYVQNFTTDGTSSSFFTISGNLSKDKGTVTYNGLTLTQCLKLESKTNIEFTAPSEGTLTLVFNSDSKNVKIDGNKIAATNGIVTSKLAAGKHTVIKGDSAYLYYMTFATEGSTTETTTAKETEATTKETETTTKETETTAKETEAPTQAPGADDNGKYDSTSADYSGAYTNISTKKDSDFANAKYVSSSEEILDAIASAKAGDVIIVKEGTYSFTSDGAAAIVIDNAKNGSENAYIILKAEEGKNVKFDFSAQSLNSANRGLVVDGDYWYFEGINFYGAGDNGVLLAGNNNIFEKCTFEANRDSGLQISRYDTNAASIDLWPSNNLIINCTAFDNCDFPDQGGTGENADGFAAKLTCGEGNVFDGCISYCNSDDGWDLFAKPATGPIGKITLRNCVAFGNGSLTNGIHYPNGDMNGFKLGGKGVGTPHSIFNCLAFNNGACGFTDNNNPSALTVLNCTAIDNAKEDSEKCNFNFYRANAGLYMNLIASKGAAKSDSFKGAVLNTTYRNGEDFYHVTTKTTFAGKKEKLGEKVSDPSSVGAFKNTNNTIDVTKNIDSLLRNADGTINMNGLYETTGEYSSMGARYNVKSQVITVALSATSGGNGEEATTEAPTSAPTQA